MDEWTTLARAVRPQGRRGEVLADLLTDFPEQFTREGGVSLLYRDGRRIPGAVTAHWLPTGRSAGRIVLKIEGFDDISAAETLAGTEIQIPSDQRVALDSETYYVNDLTGCRMMDGETEIGIVTDVHFPFDSEGRRLQNAAAIFVVERADGDEILIPFANSYVCRIDIAEKRIEMNLPHGLLELNG